MTTIETRSHQMFPVLNAAQIEVASRFSSGPLRRFAPGETVYTIGERDAPAWLILEGAIHIVRRDGLDHEAPIVTHRAGQFTGEVSQLSGRATLAGGTAGVDGCTALPFDAAHLRALMVGSAEVGEIIMRALILRRVGLIEEGGAGTILIGEPGSPDMVRLQGFLARAAYPNLVLNATSDAEGKAMVERLGVRPEELPLVVCPNGALLRKPTETQLATCLGMMPELAPDALYDVAIIGAGPSGLAAAVYAASEGLSVIVLDEKATGGQAGASSRIENYLGFPTGISGQALCRPRLQPGPQVRSRDCRAAPGRAARLHDRATISQPRGQSPHPGTRHRHRLRRALSQTRNLDLPTFEGAGVSYWASAIEARLCAGEDVALSRRRQLGRTGRRLPRAASEKASSLRRARPV